jgi:WD40 repeat protein
MQQHDLRILSAPPGCAAPLGVAAILVAAVLLLSACAPAPPTVNTPIAQHATPTDIQDEATSTSQPDSRDETPTPMLVSAWPLAANLYYLDEAGHLWQQPMAGSEYAAKVLATAHSPVRDFDIAPGEQWLAYRTDDTVAIMTLDGSRSRVITQGAALSAAGVAGSPGHESIAWSPDTGKLAFITGAGFSVLFAGSGTPAGPLIFPVSEQPVSGLSWSHDSSWLLVARTDGTSAVYSTAPLRKWVELGNLNGHRWLREGGLAFAPVEGGLAVLTPGDVNSRVFLLPQDRQVTLPFQRPDGRLAFFVHSGDVSQPGFLHSADTTALSFSAESNLPVNVGALTWEPSGQRLLNMVSPQHRLMLIDPLSGAQASFGTAGEPVTIAWGDLPPHSADGLPMTSNLYFLAAQAGVTQVWRLPASGGAPRPVTSAEADVTSYSISPTETHVAYASSGAVWHAVLNTQDVTRVVTLSQPANAQTAIPAFSPSGRQIAYADNGIWVYDLDTAQATRLIADSAPGGTLRTFDMPRWSPDGQWLLVRVTFSRGTDLAFIPAGPGAGSSGPPAALNLPGAGAEWVGPLTAFAYSAGGDPGGPYLHLIQPGNPPTSARLYAEAITGVTPRRDGRAALTRVPMPGDWPAVVTVLSTLANGTDLRIESGPIALEQPRLSPDGTLMTGLMHPVAGEDGALSGQLVVASIATGQTTAIGSITDAHSLQWGR